MYELEDVKGPIHRIEQRSQPSKHLESLSSYRDFESFDVEFSPARQILTINDYARSGALYESTVFVYGEGGKLLRTLRFDGNDDFIDKMECHYDVDGKKTGWTGYSSDGEATRRCVYRYSENLLASFSTVDIHGRPILQKDFVYADGKLVKAFTRYYGWDGNLDEIWTLDFDSSERLIQTYGHHADGRPLGDGRYTYEYDEEGKKIGSLSFNDQSPNEGPNAFTIFKYTEDRYGNWIERRKFHRFQGDPEWSKKVTHRKLQYYQEG
ncbi:MAG TPA: hypothetical protein VKZ53_03815 [Candidatus Angelobacter sp.]|nr:hypothetical protein [Candidatus Angelobacter sp.]